MTAATPPENLGAATEFRVLEVAGPSITTAPAGYEWIATTAASMFGGGARVLMCIDRGSLVGLAEVHTAWHAEATR